MRLWIPLLLAACVTPATFSSSLTSASCQRVEECTPDLFDGLYSSQADCRATLGGDGPDCYDEHCDAFDGGQAADCVQSVRSNECNDLGVTSACLDVWSDCNDLALAACLLGGG